MLLFPISWIYIHISYIYIHIPYIYTSISFIHVSWNGKLEEVEDAGNMISGIWMKRPLEAIDSKPFALVDK